MKEIIIPPDTLREGVSIKCEDWLEIKIGPIGSHVSLRVMSAAGEKTSIIFDSEGDMTSLTKEHQGEINMSLVYLSRECECEHISHMHDLAPPLKHDYGKKFPPEEIEPVRTHYGTFNVCRECATSCLAQQVVKCTCGGAWTDTNCPIHGREY